MIAYEELVAALASWRERNGLPVGAADYLGEPPAPPAVTYASYDDPSTAPADDVTEWSGEDVELSADDAIIDESEMTVAEGGYDDAPIETADEDVLGEVPLDEMPVNDIPLEEPVDEVPIEAADDAIISEEAETGAEAAIEGADETAPVDIGEMYPSVDDDAPGSSELDGGAGDEVAFISSPPPAEMEVGDATDVHHVAAEGLEAAPSDATVDQANYPIESEATAGELEPDAAPDPNDPNSPFVPIDEES